MKMQMWYDRYDGTINGALPIFHVGKISTDLAFFPQEEFFDIFTKQLSGT